MIIHHIYCIHLTFMQERLLKTSTYSYHQCRVLINPKSVRSYLCYFFEYVYTYIIPKALYISKYYCWNANKVSIRWTSYYITRV